jgi:hypothetical protein
MVRAFHCRHDGPQKVALILAQASVLILTHGSHHEDENGHRREDIVQSLAGGFQVQLHIGIGSSAVRKVISRSTAANRR